MWKLALETQTARLNSLYDFDSFCDFAFSQTHLDFYLDLLGTSQQLLRTSQLSNAAARAGHCRRSARGPKPPPSHRVSVLRRRHMRQLSFMIFRMNTK